MEHYNLLIILEKSEEGTLEDWVGLRVIQTPAYINLLQQHSGLVHENCGDFYSEI